MTCVMRMHSSFFRWSKSAPSFFCFDGTILHPALSGGSCVDRVKENESRVSSDWREEKQWEPTKEDALLLRPHYEEYYKETITIPSNTIHCNYSYKSAKRFFKTNYLGLFFMPFDLVVNTMIILLIVLVHHQSSSSSSVFLTSSTIVIFPLDDAKFEGTSPISAKDCNGGGKEIKRRITGPVYLWPQCSMHSNN